MIQKAKYKIEIASQERAQRLLDSAKSRGYTHLISISNPKEMPSESVIRFPGKVLFLQFQEMPWPIAADKESLPTIHGNFATDLDIKLLIQFFRNISASCNSATILIHCKAGISRSPTAALIGLAVLSGEKIQSAIELFNSTQNHETLLDLHMLKLADKQLSYNGLLLKSVQEQQVG